MNRPPLAEPLRAGVCGQHARYPHASLNSKPGYDHGLNRSLFGTSKQKESDMIFCHGCGKEIHETAPSCPNCGAPQKVAQTGNRNVGKLIGMGLLWTLAFWIGGLFLGGMIVGALDPQNAQEAGEQLGQTYSGLFLLGGLILSVILTSLGVLPGTRKDK